MNTCFVKLWGNLEKNQCLFSKIFGREKYLGGVLAIARHLSSFCKNLHVLSMLGSNNSEKIFIKKKLKKILRFLLLEKKTHQQ